MPLDPKTTALLLIEYQNDFTTEGGALHQGVRAVMQSTNMLANSLQAANEARVAGVTASSLPFLLPKATRITADLYGTSRCGRCECLRARHLGRGHRGCYFPCS